MHAFRMLTVSLFLFAGNLMAQMIFTEPPENFNPVVEVAGCFVQVGDDVLFLKRQPTTDGCFWGIPGGKLEEGESALSAVLRETQEETGISLLELDTNFLAKVYVRYPQVDFIYHMFGVSLKEYPKEIVINSIEHIDYRWMTLQSATKELLIPGSEECFKMLFGEKVKE